MQHDEARPHLNNVNNCIKLGSQNLNHAETTLTPSCTFL